MSNETRPRREPSSTPRTRRAATAESPAPDAEDAGKNAPRPADAEPIVEEPTATGPSTDGRDRRGREPYREESMNERDREPGRPYRDREAAPPSRDHREGTGSSLRDR